jgi:S-adenosylmethionine decarboxylase
MKIFEITQKIEEVKDEDYGQEVILDLHDVPMDFFNKDKIRKFTEELCDEIKMKKGPNYVWGDDNELGTMHNPKADGISCIQFLYSSSITMHCIDELQKAFLNVFSCQEFDADKVKKFAEDNIGGTVVSFHNIIRK